MTQPDPEQRESLERRYVRLFAALAALVSILPALYALIAAPPGARYLGIQTNLDDHMVYAAWMRQAMDGHILFDNRFTTDAQPGLTVNVFFFALGLFAKVLGIPLAMTLARAGFSALFVWLAYRLIRQVAPDVYATKLALTLTTVAGGLGFVVWHTFGQTIVRPEAKFLAGPLNGRLPTDVWQPEGFVFPSMLTSALFMASLCLILYVLLCVLAARAGAKSVVPGALAMAALMNIHSYDVLLVGFIMLGLLMATAARGDVDWRWVGRSALILLGALPAALWFLYVLRHDPVFQVRAATPTFSPGFRQVVFGYLPALALGLLGLAMARFGDEVPAKQRRVGTGLLTVAIAVMFAVGASQGNGYWMEAAAWTAMAVLFLVLIGLLAEDSPAWNLIVSWAALGLIAPYFPALFQRKLAMGLAIPWAILAALGLAAMLRGRERGDRNLATILAIVLMGGSSLRWALRETQLARANVSSTTVHPVYLSSDARGVVDYLNAHSASAQRTVVIAMPGVALPGNGPDEFQSPYMPDLNPILSGLTGVYTYAGHWSETPDYLRRRGEQTRLFLATTPAAQRAGFLAHTGATYLVAPVPQAFPELQLADLRTFGIVVRPGTQFNLVRVGSSGSSPERRRRIDVGQGEQEAP